MKAVINVAPTAEPVTVPEVKIHLRQDHNFDDSYIADLITACRERVEEITNRAIMTQTWDYYLDEFPDEDYITLPFGNLQSVTSVKYKDSDGDETTMTVNTDYLVETNGEGFGRIVLPEDVSWPTDVLYPSNPITIRFVCGWASASAVPQRIKWAIKLLCGESYVDRGDMLIGQRLIVTQSNIAERILFNERLWGRF